jgi:hypothetical protein
VIGALCVVALAGVHPGGDVQEHVRAMLQADARGCAVRIEGVCASACTVFLGARDVCVSPGARLMFHAPTVVRGDPEMRAFFVDYLSAWYPEPLRSWFRGHVADSGRDHWVSGAELIRHGVRECK